MRNSIRNTLGGLLLGGLALGSNAPRAEAVDGWSAQSRENYSQQVQTDQCSEGEALFIGLSILALGTTAAVVLGIGAGLKAAGYDSKHPYQN